MQITFFYFSSRLDSLTYYINILFEGNCVITDYRVLLSGRNGVAYYFILFIYCSTGLKNIFHISFFFKLVNSFLFLNYYSL